MIAWGGFTLESKTKEIPKSRDLIVQEQFGPKKFTLGSKFKILKSDVHVASLCYQILLQSQVKQTLLSG